MFIGVSSGTYILHDILKQLNLVPAILNIIILDIMQYKISIHININENIHIK